MTRWTAYVALAAAALLAVTGCEAGAGDAAGGEFSFVAPGGDTDIRYPVEERQEMPPVAGEDLFDEDEEISTEDFAGEVVVINIWGQWCGPCRREAPVMQRIHEEFADEGVQVLGIDVRDPSRQAAQDFMADRGLDYPSIYDPPGKSLLALSGYPRNIVPSTIIVDREQRVAAVFLRELLYEDLRPEVERLAAE
ncbi:TlpA family protein disulfide reductase [Haloechinothrix sp. YIM 98757]|uniref:TlpA family protein disulfide reductase n=1 Tax=Haloechinothrix aidingensis TaxID=2752311 RepID=A0A837ZWU7_9PSEU|nr:TlpA disulfide reductase family protein [Haloechinothrix aidingensis]MBA0124614.1 TlpA family protein disulfide reductase [Haloechinothrix aidingensis]